ncbi:hypothetical protein OG432_21950 [Streptomyces sp. NBC_00442]
MPIAHRTWGLPSVPVPERGESGRPPPGPPGTRKPIAAAPTTAATATVQKVARHPQCSPMTVPRGPPSTVARPRPPATHAIAVAWRPGGESRMASRMLTAAKVL